MTNEALQAILEGLEVKPEDYILAIGGSGDQAFAILEYAKRVLAVDYDGYQVRYIKSQAKSLRVGNYKKFLERREQDSSGYRGQNEGYFEARGRLDRIRERLPDLEIRKAEIRELCKHKNSFNKLYLSNAYGYHDSWLDDDFLVVTMHIPLYGLVYVSNGIEIQDKEKLLSKSGLTIHKKLNDSKLKKDEKWTPLILRKIVKPKPLKSFSRV